MGGRCGRDAGRPGRTDPVGRAGMGGRTSALSTLPMTAGETPEALLRRATELQRAGRVREAIETYERLLAVRPDLPDSWYNLGYLQRWAGQFEAALASYQQDRMSTRLNSSH